MESIQTIMISLVAKIGKWSLVTRNQGFFGERFCEICSTGVGTWVSHASNAKRTVRKRKEWFNKRYQKAKELRDAQWQRYRWDSS